MNSTMSMARRWIIVSATCGDKKSYARRKPKIQPMTDDERDAYDEMLALLRRIQTPVARGDDIKSLNEDIGNVILTAQAAAAEEET